MIRKPCCFDLQNFLLTPGEIIYSNINKGGKSTYLHFASVPSQHIDRIALTLPLGNMVLYVLVRDRNTRVTHKDLTVFKYFHIK